MSKKLAVGARRARVHGRSTSKRELIGLRPANEEGAMPKVLRKIVGGVPAAKAVSAAKRQQRSTEKTVGTLESKAVAKKIRRQTRSR